MWRALGTAPALLCAVVIAACGSSSSKSPTTGASTTEAGAIAGNVLVRLPTVPEPSGAPPTLSGSSDLDQRAYLTKVFDDTQALWQRQFAAASQPYRPAKLVLFSQAIQATGCGAQADVGPFYCPADHGIYLDLNFFQLLVQRFGIGGFAQAYIVATSSATTSRPCWESRIA